MKMKSLDKFANVLLNGLIIISALIPFWLLFSFVAGAESIPFREYKDDMRKEGQFLSVHLSVGSPIRIFVVGKEEAKVDLSKLKLTVKRLNPYPGKILKTDLRDHYYMVNDSEPMAQGAELEITLKSNTTDEKFRFNLKQNVP